MRICLLLLLLGAVFVSPASAEDEKKTAGLLLDRPEAQEGYVLLAPLFDPMVYLIDREGRVVHRWECLTSPGQSTTLLENGRLLRTSSSMPKEGDPFHGGGKGGRIQEYGWDGELLWDFDFLSEHHCPHHDAEKLPNGNVLFIAWERKSPREAASAGRDPEFLGEDGLWPDMVLEVKPNGRSEGEIVWEWHAWDHLVQERDKKVDNYGKVVEHPEKIHLNHSGWQEQISDQDREKLEAVGYLGRSKRKDGPGSQPDFMHTNSIDYHPELDQILLSVHGYNEIWVIDHSTTTEEAAGSQGGRYGRGGDLLYRWGNPAVYGAGASKDQQLFAQHDAQWIPARGSGPDPILIFNNGRGRPGGDYSSVDEILPPLKEDGRYAWPKGSAAGPDRPRWSYAAPEKKDFYSHFISGATRLSSGNTLICAGATGTLMEVTAEKELVWKYVNPLEGKPPGPWGGFRRGPGGPPSEEQDRGRGRPQGERGPGRRGPGGPGEPGPGGGMPSNNLFMAPKYAPDFPGLKGKKLDPGEPLAPRRIENS